MIGNFPACIKFTLQYEGGFQDAPNDPGNYRPDGTLVGTNFGISAASYPTLDIRDLTQPEAEAIYQRDYWQRIYGDSLPLGLDMVTFDWAVNSGVGTAARALQAHVGVLQDGDIGPVTLYGCSKYPVKSLIGMMTASRVALIKGLGLPATEIAALMGRATACEAVALGMVG